MAVSYDPNEFGGNQINNPYDGNGLYNPFENQTLGNIGSVGGGGGGGYTPPVPTNPTFVPPSAVQESIGNPLTITLVNTGDIASEFFEGDISKGIGTTNKIVYSPSLTFGSKRKYESKSEGYVSLNYYEVAIIKKYENPLSIAEPTIPNFTWTIDMNINAGSTMFNGMGGGSTFGNNPAFNYNYGYNQNYYNFNYDYNRLPNTTPITANEKNYTENLAITKYIWNGSSYVQDIITNADGVSGAFTLTFEFEVSKPKDVPASPNFDYEIIFSSNFKNELGNLYSLKYDILNESGTSIKNGLISLEDGSALQEITRDSIKNGKVVFTIIDNSSTFQPSYGQDLSFTKLYWGKRSIITNPDSIDYSKLNEVFTSDTKFAKPSNLSFEISSGELASSLVVIALFQKEISVAEPTIEVYGTQFDVRVKESDTEKGIAIPFKTDKADYVLVYLTADKTLKIPATDGSVELYFQKDYAEVYGSKRVILVAVSNQYGTGQRKEIIVNFTAVNDYPSIIEVNFPLSIEIPSFSDFNIDLQVKYSTFAATSVDIALQLGDKSYIDLLQNQTPNGEFNINLKKLRDTYPKWLPKDGINLKLKPYNRGGAEQLIGNDYEINVELILPKLFLDEDIISKLLFDSFVEQIRITEPEKESKYLTHLSNFGNNEQILVSSFEEDNWTLSEKKKDELGNEVVSKEVKSVILKLYSPLPANYTENTTFWVTKLMSSPLIETVVLNEQDSIKCPPIKGPNFDIEVDFVIGNSTNFESLDNLILSSSESSNDLVRTYLSSSLSYQEDLNIEYGSGSNLIDGYLWDNFVHFSSAKERVDNFVYKVQLIEAYEAAISASQTASFANSPESPKQIEKNNIKKNQIIQSFDGFENFLYTSSSLSWPHDANGIRLNHTNNIVVNWYTSVIETAETFDLENPNWIMNNVPTFINNVENSQSFHLLLNMLAHHFDIIYYYTKSIENGRGMGYKSKNGISDKLLFDTLKSFNWDAKNLSADSKLWEHVFGKDSNGNTKNTSPAKQRTYEVWRRIANNLPYLLKHKGTRRGIYALMSCYGIPSSNLSILEFGGPEVSDVNKSKLVMDNVTTALVMNNGSRIDFEWKNTELNRKPDTIEFFVKPSEQSNFRIISGSGWNLEVTSSVTSSYGKVVFNYSGSNCISSSLLPIFNGKFFGVELSRTSGAAEHIFALNLRQADKERTIFETNVSTSVATGSFYWDSGSLISLGNNFVGSVDEFRLWSTPLDKERFYEHVSFPEMINGNHISSSTDDLFFRLDFEYPKNLAVSSSLLNVDTNIYFSSSLYRNDLESGSLIVGDLILSENPSASYSASAYGFTNIGTYPHNFEAIDRSVVLEIPDMGSTRYSTNKVRFESQTDFDGNDVSGGVDLSIKSRATKKAFDQAPTDSNRVGLFFSPTKELNIDIAKSMGGLNLDNYIGDPSDKYKSNYKSLDSLRNYYFKRFDNRDIYSYINLIKLYEKSMFEDIKKMLPARVKATTGLLIEPHILERSKIQQKRPSGDEYQQDTTIDYTNEYSIVSDINQYEAIVDGNLSENVIAENNQYEAIIYSSSLDRILAENNQYDSLITTNDNFVTDASSYQKEVNIDAGLGEPTILTEIDLINSNTIVGQTDYETIGFGIYAQSGSAIRTYFNKDGRRVKERIRVNLVTEQKTRDIVKYKTSINGVGDPRDGMILSSSVYTETTLNIQPFSGSTQPIVKGSIVSVTPVSGYLKTHYRNTSDLTRGMENSFYRGSKNTAATTLDGSSPIETFVSNPNTLTVNKTGRGASEPILEVE
jgi:hypothetical protein